MARVRTTAAFFARTGAAPAGPTRVLVTRRPGTVHLGLLRCGSIALPCALGRSGLTRFKREGDGATPVGRLALLAGFRRADRALPPGGPLPLRPLRPDDGWCDDAGDGRYNRLVRRPFGPSHEALHRDDDLYDVVIVLDWNIRPRRLGSGSAIFFHLARPDFSPTAGCVAITAAAMRRLLPRLGRGAELVIG